MKLLKWIALGAAIAAARSAYKKAPSTGHAALDRPGPTRLRDRVESPLKKLVDKKR